MDADRMDYLRRDSYYCGVSYGTSITVWLTSNITAVEHQGKLAMALLHKAFWGVRELPLRALHHVLSVY